MTIALIITSSIFYDYFFLGFLEVLVVDFLGSFSRPMVGIKRTISIVVQTITGIKMWSKGE